MIVRIAGEGQYELDGGAEELNDLDNAVVDACDSGDEAAFRQRYERMLDFVRRRGHVLEKEVLVGSDLIMPPADVTLEEARRDFTGEGLLPG